MFVSHIIPYNIYNQVQIFGQIHTYSYLFIYFLMFPLYTTVVDFKSNNQDVIEVKAFSFNSKAFKKVIGWSVGEL